MSITRSILTTAIAAATGAALAGCAPPPAAGPAPGATTAPTAVTPAATTPGAAPIVTGPTRLTGLAEINGSPMAGAKISAFDLATGKSMALVAAGGGNLVAAGGGNLVAAGGGNIVAAGGGNYALAQAAGSTTDAQGGFDYEMPDLEANQVVKLVAVKDGQTLVTLFDGRGHAIGAQPGSGYVIQQASGRLTVKLKLTPASTAASKAFEGAIKIQFRLPDDAVAGGIEKAIEQAMAAMAALEERLAADPTVGEALLAALDGGGELTDVAAFNAALASAGLVDVLADKVSLVMRDFAAADKGAKNANAQADLDAMTSEDFPIGKIKITTEGDFSYTDEDGETISGTISDGAFIPTEKPDTDDGPDDFLGDTSGGSSSGGSTHGGNNDPEEGTAKGGLDITDGVLVDPIATEGVE